MLSVSYIRMQYRLCSVCWAGCGVLRLYPENAVFPWYCRSF